MAFQGPGKGPWNAESQSQRRRSRLQHREVRRRVRPLAARAESARRRVRGHLRRRRVDGRHAGAAGEDRRRASERPGAHAAELRLAGRTRNLGMRHAKGEYIQFVDHDDMLGPEALERLYEHAERNDADVVLGKMSSTMVRPRRLFRHPVDACTIENDELMQSMSPHKMFRRGLHRGARAAVPRGALDPGGPGLRQRRLSEGRADLGPRRLPLLLLDEAGRRRQQHPASLQPASRLLVATCRHHRAADQGRHSGVRRRRRAPEPAAAPACTTWRSCPGPASRRSSTRSRPNSGQRFKAARQASDLEEFPAAVREGLPTVSRLRAELLERRDFDGAAGPGPADPPGQGPQHR